jgi:hypothetical protein
MQYRASAVDIVRRGTALHLALRSARHAPLQPSRVHHGFPTVGLAWACFDANV